MSKKTKRQPVLTILVPVYNEEVTISSILDRVTRLPIEKYEVIVVDDFSADKSPAIIESFKKSFKSKSVMLTTVRHAKNMGKGATIQTAVKLANGRYFVIQDADLEYYPEDIPRVLEHALDNDYDVVYGSRFKGEISGMPRPNFLANHFYNFLLRRLYNTQITDMHTCYKMLKTDLFRKLGIRSNGFNYATELISKLLRNNFHINEVPIKFTGRTKEEGKKINVGDGIECISNLFIYRYKKQFILNDSKDKKSR